MATNKAASARRQRKTRAARKKSANARAHYRAGRKKLGDRSTAKAAKKYRKASDGSSTASANARRSRSSVGAWTGRKAGKATVKDANKKGGRKKK